MSQNLIGKPRMYNRPHNLRKKKMISLMWSLAYNVYMYVCKQMRMWVQSAMKKEQVTGEDIKLEV